MQHIFSTKRICRAGIIAALYVALTVSFGAIGYSGILEIRPAEALCILPLFYIEAVPALYIGCMLANVLSQFGVYDIFVGSLATLVAAVCTFLTGVLIREAGATKLKHALRAAVGGFFPVIVNAVVIPVVIVYLAGGAEESYWLFFGSMCATEALWIYGLGAPLYLLVTEMRKKNVAAFLSGKKPAKEQKELTSE